MSSNRLMVSYNILVRNNRDNFGRLLNMHLFTLYWSISCVRGVTWRHALQIDYLLTYLLTYSFWLTVNIVTTREYSPTFVDFNDVLFLCFKVMCQTLWISASLVEKDNEKWRKGLPAIGDTVYNAATYVSNSSGEKSGAAKAGSHFSPFISTTKMLCSSDAIVVSVTYWLL